MNLKIVSKDYKIQRKILKKNSVRNFFKTFLNLTFLYGGKYFKRNINYKNWDDKNLNKSLLLLRNDHPKKFSLIYDNIQKTAAIKRLVIENNLDLISAKFLGTDPKTVFHYNSFLRMDLPGDTKNSLPWHQDPQLNKHDKFDACTTWCPLVDIDSKIGPLNILLKSNKKIFPTNERGRITENIAKKISSQYKLKKIAINKNDGFIYENLLVHKSGINNSHKIRFVLVSHFNKMIKN